MTLRSDICFSTLGIALLITAPIYAGMVGGRIILTGSHEKAVKSRNDFAGVVVWLKALDDSSVSYPRKRVQMLQKGKKFSPHILVISAGTSVDFPNLDPIFHNAFSNFDGQIFDIGLYPPGSSRTVRFDRPGIVRVFCNIHPSMSAIIVVVDSPYFTKTDESGGFCIPNVPPGAYELHFFHERATPEALNRLVRRISVDSGPLELDAVTISESGYLPVGHKNKYGRDYPPNAESEPAYSIR